MNNMFTKIKLSEEVFKAIKEKKAAEEERDQAIKDLDYVDRENDEYRQAKREYNANKRRITYLENMIETAVVISTEFSMKEQPSSQLPRTVE